MSEHQDQASAEAEETYRTLSAVSGAQQRKLIGVKEDRKVTIRLTMPGGVPLNTVFGAMRSNGLSVRCTGEREYLVEDGRNNDV